MDQNATLSFPFHCFVLCCRCWLTDRHYQRHWTETTTRTYIYSNYHTTIPNQTRSALLNWCHHCLCPESTMAWPMYNTLYGIKTVTINSSERHSFCSLEYTPDFNEMRYVGDCNTLRYIERVVWLSSGLLFFPAFFRVIFTDIFCSLLWNYKLYFSDILFYVQQHFRGFWRIWA